MRYAKEERHGVGRLSYICPTPVLRSTRRIRSRAEGRWLWQMIGAGASMRGLAVLNKPLRTHDGVIFVPWAWGTRWARDGHEMATGWERFGPVWGGCARPGADAPRSLPAQGGLRGAQPPLFLLHRRKRLCASAGDPILLRDPARSCNRRMLGGAALDCIDFSVCRS